MFNHVCSHAIWPKWAAMILASGSVSECNGIFVLRLFQLQVFFFIIIIDDLFNASLSLVVKNKTNASAQWFKMMFRFDALHHELL